MIRIAPPGMRSKPLRLRQGGFTLVTGIFLFVVLAALAAFIIGIRLYQDSSISLDTLGSRALAAARTGGEWGAYNSVRNNTCTPTTPIALGGTLSAYMATVTCTRSTHNEAGTTVNIDTIVATACNQPVAGNCPNPAPGAGYAERQISIVVGNCGAVPCP